MGGNSTGSTWRRGGGSSGRPGWIVIPCWGSIGCPREKSLEEAQSTCCLAKPFRGSDSTFGKDCPTPTHLLAWNPAMASRGPHTSTMQRLLIPPASPHPTQGSHPPHVLPGEQRPGPAACNTFLQPCHHALAAAFSARPRAAGTSWRGSGCQPRQGRYEPAAGRKRRRGPVLQFPESLLEGAAGGGKGISLPPLPPA